MQQQKVAEQLTRARDAINEAENALQDQEPSSRNAKSSSAQYSRLGVYVPVDLHRRLKVYAARAGREISDIAIDAFLEYLARNE